MFVKALFSIGLMAGLLWVTQAHAQQEPETSGQKKEGVQGCFFNFQFENDLFGSGADSHYTHGSRLSVVVPEPASGLSNFSCHPLEGQVETGAGLLRMLLDDLLLVDARQRRVSFVLGQNLFTPEDIRTSSLIANDRPYAGWLYAGIGLVAERETGDRRAVDNFELDIGVVGPAAFGEDVQNFWHREVINVREAEGWQNQLKNEIGVLALYERKWPFRFQQENSRMGFEVTPSLGGALGNIYTYAAAGGSVRWGRNLPNDYGPPRIQPGLHGSGFFDPEPDSTFGWYLFAGIEARAVARNIFLDGNTFRDSHSVDKRPFVGDFQVGFVMNFQHVRVSFTNIFRSKEFYGQRKFDEFGSINFSFRF